MSENFNWITVYATDKVGASEDYQTEWKANRFLIADKMFGMLGTDKTGRPIVTLKLIPVEGDALRSTYPDKIVSGYYMNKLHWNSVYLDTDVPALVIKEMIDKSYTLILNGFSQKKQAEILAEK